MALELSEEAITLLEWILQKARLVKVHVILVTSLPSSRSLSSGILSNTDYRIAFRVTSKADSIRAIGRAGANELATPGEMIVRNGSDIVRCKAAYMADDDLRRLCMEAAERYEDEVGDYFPIWDTASNHAAKKNGNTIDGALIDEAARIVVENRIGSTSALQRKLKVGYAMASRIMDELEARGVVGLPTAANHERLLWTRFKNMHALEWRRGDLSAMNAYKCDAVCFMNFGVLIGTLHMFELLLAEIGRRRVAEGAHEWYLRMLKG